MLIHEENRCLAKWVALNGGQNLEYDARFLALHQAATEKPEQQFGDTIIEAQAPEWSQVLSQAEALLQETADLRVLLLFTWAQVERTGLQGYAQGLDMLLQLFDVLWDDLHPRLQEDGEFDPFPRMNVLGAFVDMHGIVKAVRASALLTDQHGFLSLRDAENVIEGNKTELFAGGRLRLQELLKQARQDPVSPMSIVLKIEQQLNALRIQVEQKLGIEWTPDFTAVLSCVGTVTQLVVQTGSVVPDHDNKPTQVSAERDVVSEVQHVVPMNVASWQDAAIQNREQATLMLEKVCSYFETHEPSHPAPILLKRAQQTIPMSFPEILQDLLPTSAEHFDIWMPKDGQRS